MLNLKYTFILFSFLFSSECKYTHEHKSGEKNIVKISEKIMRKK